MCILDTKGHSARGRAVFLHEVGGVAFRLIIENEVDAALTIQGHILGTMACDGLKAEEVKYFREMFYVGSGEFDKFEAVKAHGVIEEIWHESLLRGT